MKQESSRKIWSKSCLLLQNEGALMQGCFKASLTALRAGSSAERGPFYVAFFNYAAGVERLLKVIVALDHLYRHGKFPNVKPYAHKIPELYDNAKKLFKNYGVEWKNSYEPDDVDRRLFSFLSEFANGSRYFNLDELGGTARTADPLEVWEELLRAIYEKDVPAAERLGSEQEVNAVAGRTRAHTVYLPATDMLGKQQSYVEFCQDHGRMSLVLPQVCWRLVRMLVPLQALLTAIREHIHKQDFQRRGEDADPSTPFMEEFLDFVCGDKQVVLESSDWP